MGFSRHEYWSGLPFPPPGDLPGPGVEPGSLALQADFFSVFPREPLRQILKYEVLQILPDKYYAWIHVGIGLASLKMETPSVRKKVGTFLVFLYRKM